MIILRNDDDDDDDDDDEDDDEVVNDNEKYEFPFTRPFSDHLNSFNV